MLNTLPVSYSRLKSGSARVSYVPLLFLCSERVLWSPLLATLCLCKERTNTSPNTVNRGESSLERESKSKQNTFRNEQLHVKETITLA